MSNPQLIATCAAAAMFLSVSAQAQPPPAQIQSQRAGGPPADAPASNGAANDSETHSVLRITSVEVMRSTHEPTLDIIRVRGLASSGGWEEAELVPLTRGVPADGVLQLILVARPPEVASDATGYEPVEAIFPLEPSHPFKGVTVHAATNGLSVAVLPGYAESKATFEDCGSCVGKVLVPKGTSTQRNDVVHEEKLPPDSRIVRPGDGMSGQDSNPNRLTLILDKDERVVSAVWD